MPESANSEVSAEVAFTDTVIGYSPSLDLGAPLFFKVQPAWLTGRMAVPDPESTLGNAAFLVGLRTKQITVVAVDPVDHVFEKQLPDGDELSWNASALLTEDLFPLVRVTNGKLYEFTIQLYAAAGVHAPLMPAAVPPLGRSLAQFRSTFTWNGIAGFFDEQGRPLHDVGFTSTTGFDWVSTPAPAATLLQIEQIGNQVVISWPDTDTGYTLQRTASLSPAHWIPVSEVPTRTGNRWTIAVGLGDLAFFRAVRP